MVNFEDFWHQIPIVLQGARFQGVEVWRGGTGVRGLVLYHCCSTFIIIFILIIVVILVIIIVVVVSITAVREERIDARGERPV